MERCGGQVLVEAEVTDILTDDGRLTGVITGDGREHRAEHVVLASGAWSADTALVQPDGKPRGTIDPDSFSSGFATWSGTSFAAPVLAGRFAAALSAAGCPTDTDAPFVCESHSFPSNSRTYFTSRGA